MDPQCSASVGSAALEIVQDPALADVGVASEERIAGQCGQSAIQDSCDEKPQDALFRNSSEKMTGKTRHQRSTQLHKFQQEAARCKKYVNPMI